jgi:hypothetical protein
MAEYGVRTEISLTNIEENWNTAVSHWPEVRDSINIYFGVAVDPESMQYIMASSARDVNYSESINAMEDFDMGSDGFYDWLDAYYGNRTITPGLIPMENNDHDEMEPSDMERQLLEHYSSTGRGIPIQIRERG